MTTKALALANLIGANNKISVQALPTEATEKGTSSFTDTSSLPLSGNTVGDQAFVEGTNRLYIWNGSGWYNIALINTNPSFDSGGGPEVSYELDSAGGSPTVITLLATDPEEVPITYSAIPSDSAQYFADITQEGNQFTITAKDTNIIEQYDPAGGSFSVTFRASDGVNLATALSEFSITFNTVGDWSSPTFREFTSADFIDPTDQISGGGASISPDGSLALLGTSGDRFGFNSLGGLNIFRLSGETWVPESALFASPGVTNNGFAGSPSTVLYSFNTISCSEDNGTIVVGAPLMDVSSDADRGGIFIFEHNSGEWSQTAHFTFNSYSSSNDKFGSLVRISPDGQTVLAGQPLWDYTGFEIGDIGGASVYRRINGTWSAETPSTGLPFSGRVDNGYAGSAGDISYDGSTVACNSNKDSVEVFIRSGSTWSQQASFSSGAGIRFGFDISMTYDGNVLAIGAQWDSTSGIRAGAVYIWERSGSTWSQTHKIVPAGLVDYSRYGTGVSISGDGNVLAVEMGDAYSPSREIFIHEKQPDGSWLQVNRIPTDPNVNRRAGWNGITIAKKTGSSLITSPSNYSFSGESVAMGVYKSG